MDRFPLAVKLVCFIVLGGWLPACTAAPPIQTASPTSGPTQAFASQTPIPNTEPAATQTMAPTSTHTPSPSPTSTLFPTPTSLACWAEGGQVVTGQLETDLLRQPLDYRIYLPPCYYEQPDRRYPVLYLIHGQSYNDDQWDRLGVDETMDRLVGSAEIPPFLIVMPRDREWTQSNVDPFGRAVIEALLPYIEQIHRTLPDRAYRAVGGLSRGGGWAIHFALKHWEQFGVVGGHSPPVFWSDVPDIKSWLDEIPVEALPRIWLDIGENDRPEILESALWFEKLLTQRGIPHEWHMFSGYHEEAYWEAHVERYLRWYAQGW
jgi:enterochelin esterase-like enzyme